MRRRTVTWGATALTLVVGAAMATAMNGTALAASTITNPGFEANGASQTPTGWIESGTVTASKSEAGGRTGGGNRLTHWASSAYQVETLQNLNGLANATYTLRMWVRSGGGQIASYIALRNCGGTEARTNIPTSNNTWVQISVSKAVTGGVCTAAIVSNARAGNWINVDDVEFLVSGSQPTTPPPTTPPASGIQIRGVDISSLKKNEDRGALYFNSSGQQGDAIALLRSGGANYARLKVWVNPADGYNNKARVLQMATRIKAAGMKLLIDFHYSDSWADPGKQVKPAAWNGLSFAALRDALYNHTFDVCNSLRLQGTPADMVQIGNETNPGMLLPDGSTNNWNNLAQLLTAGSNAAKAANASTRVMLHLAEGGNNSLFRWWFDNATQRGVPFDVIGASYYPYWHGPLSGLQFNLNDMAARYNKDVVVAETAYGFTLAQDDFEPNIFNSSLQQAGGYPATPAGQVQQLRDVFNVVRNVPNGRGLGVFYWEPAWTAQAGSGWDPTNPNSGNGWENQAVFDYNSRALPALSVFGQV